MNEINDNELNEEDIPSDAFIDSELEEGDLICPRSGKEIMESPMAYEFPGFPDLTCWKERSKRKMSADDYAAALEAHERGEDPPILEGFKNKEGKKYAAGIKLKEGETEWEPFFPADKESTHKCPISGDPIAISQYGYKMVGYPNITFSKVILKREMSIPDYLEILEADGERVPFKRFISKKGKKFDAYLYFDKEKNKVEFYMPEKEKK